jgi:hypothetical protein
MRGTPGGPFPWPKSVPQPVCGNCQEPLLFMGLLDFRTFSDVSNLRLPGQALALHGCPTSRCGVLDPENCAITWFRDGIELEIVGDQSRAVEVGTAWHSVDFPTVTYWAHELTDDRHFSMEGSVYQNFTCSAPKIGGHVMWIQDAVIPVDSKGQPMTFIGQFFGTADVEIGDGGIAYIFFSEATAQTEVVVQFY